MKRLLILFVLFGALTNPAVLWAQQAVDFISLSAKISPDTLHSAIDGDVRLYYRDSSKSDSIYLNGIKMKYKSVLLNGQKVAYDYNEKGIWLKPDQNLLKDTNYIDIQYSCAPRKGIYFIGWDDITGLSKKQIWTQGQGIDHRHWLPHKDDQTDKLLIDLTIVFKENYEVIANGKLVGKKEVGKGLISWRYTMSKPMSSYLMAIAIGRYDLSKTESNKGTPLFQYYYPERRADYDRYYFKNEEIFDFMVKEVGMDYPWQNYKQVPVQDFRHGAMENTTATLFGDFFLVDELAFNDKNYTYVNAHELAHHWFGNLVTALNSDHHWLHEGFATYYQWLSERDIYGEEHFDWMRYKEAALVFEASLNDTIPLGNGKAGSSRFYQKGAWVLYMLKAELGEEKFRETIRYYLDKNKGGIVTTDSLLHAVEKVNNIKMDTFFELWVHTPGEPEISIRQVNIEDDELKLHISQSDTVFSQLPISFSLELVYTDGSIQSKRFSFTMDERELSIPLDKKLAYWNFDPDMGLLANVEEIKPYAMWTAQLKDEQLLNRLEAVKRLAFFEEKEKTILLRDIFLDTEEHFGIRAEILSQLIKDGSRAERYLKIALRDNDVQLQKEAVKLVRGEMKSLQPILLELAKSGKSYELRENALYVAASLGAISYSWLSDEVFEKKPGIPGYKVEIASLVYRYLLYNDEKAMDKLVHYTSSGFDFMTRMSAIQAAGALQLTTDDLVYNLFDAFFDTNWKLRREAQTILQGLNQNKETRKFISNYLQTHSSGFKDFQKQMVNRTFNLNIN